MNNMMQNSPAPEMPMYDQGHEQQAQSGMADMMQQGLAKLSPEELQEMDMFITPRFAQLVLKAMPELSPLFMPFAQEAQQPQPAQPAAAGPMSAMQGIQAY